MTEPDSPKRILTIAAPAAVLTIGLCFAVYFAAIVFMQDKRRIDDLFHRTAQDHLSALDRGFNSHFETVNVLADLFKTGRSVNRSEFQVFARSLRNRHPSIQALEWVPKVTKSNRAELEFEARKTHPEFKFWDPAISELPGTSEEREVSFPIYYLEPIEGNEAALGYDPSRHPIRADAIERAVTSGELAVSAATPLVQAEATQLAFLVFVPVYADGAVPADPDSRWNQLVGLAEGVFKADDVFESAVSVLAPSGQRIILTDLDEGQSHHIHESLRTVPTAPADSWHQIECREVFHGELLIGGRTWQVEIRPIEGAFHHDFLHPIGISLAVALASLFLSLGLAYLIRRIQQAQNLVQQQTEELSHQSSHDPLTGLLNRSDFDLKVSEALEQVWDGGPPTTVAHLDLDQFKVVNEACGHAAGDEMLRQISMVLKNSLTSRDILARHGGDEFGLLLPGRPVEDSVETIQRLLSEIRAFKFPWMNRVFSVGASIGVAQLDSTSLSAAEVLSQADTARAVAKEKGRDRYHVVHSGDIASKRYREQIRWVSTVKSAIQEDLFELYRQPILPLAARSNQILAEVLLRLPMEHGSVALPGTFLPAAARFRMMNRVDQWVIQQVAGLLAEGALGKRTRVSVNVSAQSLDEEGFADRVFKVFSDAGVSLKRVCFEVTETALIGNVVHARAVVERLREAGCLFALDDFGSGMASFSYLKSLPVDFVKIEGSFVRDMATDASSGVIVRSIVEAAEAFGMQTIAEWVEDEKTYELLKELGVDYVQGYLLGHPEPIRRPKI